jgi:flagellar motor switch protein FliN
MDGSLTLDWLFEAVTAEFGDAIAALTGTATAPRAAEASGAAGWIATLRCTGTLDGTVTLGLSEEDLRKLCAVVLAMTAEEVTSDAAVDTLRELCNQTIGSLRERKETRGLTLSIEAAAAAESPSLDGARVFEFPLPDDFTPRLLVAMDVTTGIASAGKAEADAELAASGEPVIGAIRPSASAAAAASAPQAAAVPAAAGRNLDVLLDIELPVAVRFGRTDVPLLSLVRLGPGSVIDLHRSADEPVDIMVSGKVVARGEVVVIEGNYGVRVTEIVSASERIRTIGAQ